LKFIVDFINGKFLSQNKIYLDVTRYYFRKIHNRGISGIDRISELYIKYFLDNRFQFCIFNFIFFRKLNSFEVNLLLKKKIYFYQKFLIYIYQFFSLLFFFNFFLNFNQSKIFNVTHSWLHHRYVWLILNYLKVKKIIMIHDLIPINYPEFSISKEYLRHKRRIVNTLKYADYIITNSKDTQQTLLKFSNKAKIKNRLIISHLPSTLVSKNKTTYPLKKNYFLILGNIEPRKNHIFLFEIWRNLIKKRKLPYLYVVGRRGWECEQVIDYLKRSRQLQKYIIELNKVDDDLLVKILKNTKALLVPSHVEGYGIIIQEALQLGTPVIASDLSVFKESAKNIPDYIDILDGKKWLSTIIDYNNKNSKLRSAQLKRIKKYQTISSEDHFKVIKNLFH